MLHGTCSGIKTEILRVTLAKRGGPSVVWRYERERERVTTFDPSVIKLVIFSQSSLDRSRDHTLPHLSDAKLC